MLPVFPLDLVVFPGMPVPLYVFEERYKTLVRHCLASDDPRFVIALAVDGDVIHDAPAVAPVGSYVRIVQSAENADGTFRILGHGLGRCRVDVARTEWIPASDGTPRPLHYVDADDLPIDRADPNLERVAAWDTLDAFRAYADVFFQDEARDQLDDALPDDLLYQASFVCANLRLDTSERQALLEAPSLVERFERARRMIDERLAHHAPVEHDEDEEPEARGPDARDGAEPDDGDVPDGSEGGNGA